VECGRWWCVGAYSGQFYNSLNLVDTSLLCSRGCQGTGCFLVVVVMRGLRGELGASPELPSIRVEGAGLAAGRPRTPHAVCVCDAQWQRIKKRDPSDARFRQAETRLVGAVASTCFTMTTLVPGVIRCRGKPASLSATEKKGRGDGGLFLPSPWTPKLCLTKSKASSLQRPNSLLTMLADASQGTGPAN
jgi:hypothetical protein